MFLKNRYFLRKDIIGPPHLYSMTPCLVRFKTNANSVSDSQPIHLQKKQMSVFKEQLFISVSKTLYTQILANLVLDILFNIFDFCSVFVSRC